MLPLVQTAGSRAGYRRTNELLPVLLDEHVGLIHSIDWYSIQRDDPQFLHCRATISDVSRITGWEANESAGGTGMTADEALAKAIGEAVERYCIDMYSPEEITIKSFNEIADWAFDPRRCALFHAEQYATPGFPFAPVTEHSKLVWAPGFSLTRDEPTWTPLSLIAPRHDCNDENLPFDLASVSGYACGLSWEDAVLRGICEVIERDSFMLNWYNRIPAPRVDLRNLPISLQRTLDRFRCSPVEIQCCDLTTDIGIPTYLAMMLGQYSAWPAVIVATATDLDPVHALQRALLELAANSIFVRSLLATAASVPQHASDVKNQEEHALFYSDHRRLPHLNHLRSGRLNRMTVSRDENHDKPTDLLSLVKHLADRGFEVIVVDLTTKDVEELDFRVVKVIIPGMQPLDFGTVIPHLGSNRLYESPGRMGYNIRNTRPEQLNRFPHPFP
jgi:ribosomal protein S12 methylthiotransferase accessory factor